MVRKKFPRIAVATDRELNIPETAPGRNDVSHELAVTSVHEVNNNADSRVNRVDQIVLPVELIDIDVIVVAPIRRPGFAISKPISAVIEAGDRLVVLHGNGARGQSARESPLRECAGHCGLGVRRGAPVGHGPVVRALARHAPADGRDPCRSAVAAWRPARAVFSASWLLRPACSFRTRS